MIGNLYFIVVPAVFVIGLAIWFYRRSRQQKQPRIVAIVGLLKEPMPIDVTVLAHLAGKAWNADLGDGNSEGADGFVTGTGIINVITYDGSMSLINSMPNPYVPDVESAAEKIVDLRQREAMLEHQAWFSCDSLGVDRKTPDEEVAKIYRRLARLFAELLDENCLLIYLPDLHMAVPINEDTHKALLADDPIAALQETQSAPIVQIKDDDPLLIEAVAKAKETWPQFVSAFESRAGEHLSIKAPLRHEEHVEFIWIEVTAMEGDHVFGKLANEPNHLGNLKLGSKVRVPVSDVNDWCYVDAQGKFQGGFSLAAIKAATERKR